MGRRAEVRTALEGLLQIRRMMNPPPDPDRYPAPWERQRPAHALGVLLEAAGIRPASVGPEQTVTATGYRIDTDAATVTVRWLGPRGSGAQYEQDERLRHCRRVLKDAGWDVRLVRGPGRARRLEIDDLAGGNGR